MSDTQEEESIYDMVSEPVSDHREQVQEQEESIYETQKSTSAADRSSSGANNNVETNLQNQNFTYFPNEKKLCYIGNDAESIPTEMIYEFGLKTLVLDLSFNCLSDLRDLSQFPNLEELICDNNCVSDESQFPKLDSLKIFSCNKNKIEDLHTFIDKVKVFFPSLTYLSLLGNRACPNQLVDANKDDYDYSRYRKYVLYRLKNLKFLDCYEVTQQERDMVAKESLFYDVIKYQDSSDSAKSSGAAPQPPVPSLADYYTPLPSQSKEGADENPQGSFGYCKYVYYGKQSEGNRFIRNDDL